MSGIKKIIYLFLGIVLLLTALSFRGDTTPVSYGVSFSKLHAEELGLPWKETYLAILNDLSVRKLRLSAHWDKTEPEKGRYDFEALDFQVREAEKNKASIILALGRRTPGWPECHDPLWVKNFPKDEREKYLLDYIETVVSRYKNSPSIRFWQVENEPFLDFATFECGETDEDFLSKEIALVKKLDSKHEVMITDSGEFGLWYKARSHGDIFGTSLYIYIWHDTFGYLRYPISSWFFRLKQNIVEMAFGEKETILIELGAEPWLNKPIKETPTPFQLERMGIDKLGRVVEIAGNSSFSEQYLWGAEWWYFMKKNNHPEFWEFGKKLFEN